MTMYRLQLAAAAAVATATAAVIDSKICAMCNERQKGGKAKDKDRTYVCANVRVWACV
jgi:hypothetical protein